MATGWGIDAHLVLFALFWVGDISIVSGNALVDEYKDRRFAVNFIDV